MSLVCAKQTKGNSIPLHRIHVILRMIKPIYGQALSKPFRWEIGVLERVVRKG
jgi:hypothetical protein